MMEIMKKIAARAANPGQARPVLIAFTGESVTHGAFEIYIGQDGKMGGVYDPLNSYPQKLKNRLDDLFPGSIVNILNAGVGGECSFQGAARFERDVLYFRPDLVVISFGINDASHSDDEMRLDKYRAAMSEMIRKTLASGAECIVLTTNDMCSSVSPLIDHPTLRDIAQQISEKRLAGNLTKITQVARETADEFGVPVADAYTVWQDMERSGVDTTALLSNHINHPTRNTHDIFAEALFSTMLKEI